MSASDDWPRHARVTFRFGGGQMRSVWVAAVPRVGEYVDMGDNERRYVAEVVHDINPDNVPVTCWLKSGYVPE